MTHTTIPAAPADKPLAPLTGVFWVCVSDHGAAIGVGSSDMAADFDTACDDFADCMRMGSPSCVYKLDFDSMTITDVTGDAQLRVAAWCAARGMNAPEYCEAAQ